MHIIIFAISVVYISLYMLFFQQSTYSIMRLSNAFFTLGIVYLCIAFTMHVKNSGLFKSVSYFLYRQKHKKMLKYELVEPDSKPKEMYEFAHEKYGQQTPSKLFYLFSIPLLVVSLALAYCC